MLTNPQIRVLAAMASAKGPLSRQALADLCFNGNSVNFAPILNPLVECGYARRIDLDIDGRTETDFEATDAGKTLVAGQSVTSARTVSRRTDDTLPGVGECFEREYRGETFVVEVRDDGYEVLGEVFPSLTAAAKFIIGSDTEISGPAFFGFR